MYLKMRGRQVGGGEERKGNEVAAINNMTILTHMDPHMSFLKAEVWKSLRTEAI